MSWLMAFPMSGVAYTYHLLSSLTSHDNDDDSNTLTLGTNYALNRDQPSTYRDRPDPFLYCREELTRIHHNHKKQNRVLVMTHCAHSCTNVNQCNHPLQTLWTFDTQYRMTYKMDAHDCGLIDVDLVPKSMINYDKTIHLIRDPPANLVSLFNLQQFENRMTGNGTIYKWISSKKMRQILEVQT